MAASPPKRRRREGPLGDPPFERTDDLARVYDLRSVIEKLDEVRLARIADDPEGIRASSIRPVIGLGFEVLPSLLAIDGAWAEPNLSV